MAAQWHTKFTKKSTVLNRIGHKKGFAFLRILRVVTISWILGIFPKRVLLWGEKGFRINTTSDNLPRKMTTFCFFMVLSLYPTPLPHFYGEWKECEVIIFPAFACSFSHSGSHDFFLSFPTLCWIFGFLLIILKESRPSVSPKT